MAMTLRLPEELDRQLTELARRESLSKQQLVVREMTYFAERNAHENRTRRNMERVLRENAELLEDLART